jgi:YbgC/YbaW family acyl-CoA thioester hydrolase
MSNPASLSKTFNTILWGNSVALAWAWGIGLFLSIQIAIQFGFDALVKFATIDAVGLTLFGVINERIASKYSDANHFEQGFLNKAKNFKFGLLFYQLLAISVTLYACLKYVTLPLGILSILVAGVFIGATIFLGEEFPINRIKYSHGIFGVLVIGSALMLINSSLFNSDSVFQAALSSNPGGVKAEFNFNSGFLSWLEQARNYVPLYEFKSPLYYWAFGVPLVIGFLCGPWLDIQNWQRVIQIKKEGLSCTQAYVVAGVIFWLLIMVNGSIALACFQYARENLSELLAGLSNIDPSSFFYSIKNIITMTFSNIDKFEPLLGLYILFIGVCALATFDSGYIAYKWYLDSLLKDNKSIIFSFLPSWLFSSPILGFFACIVLATVTMHFSEFGKFIAQFDPSLEKFFRIELEYYLAFYAAFFIIYAVCLYRNLNEPSSNKTFSALKLFSTSLSCIAIFGIGYFSENTLVMAAGSLLPFIYGWYTESKADPAKDLIEEKPETPLLIAPSAKIITDHNFTAVNISSLPANAKPVSIKGCYIQDGWFVHQFIPTYQDTNSVGNVYFAMYLMWVGKTRELFFAHVMPDFDPKDTEFFILTRNIEHKFQKEIKEFDEAKICIRISDYNRKFVTMEHKILDAEGALVGKGKQTLMFVDSKNYGLVDIPSSVQNSFVHYVAV